MFKNKKGAKPSEQKPAEAQPETKKPEGQPAGNSGLVKCVVMNGFSMGGRVFKTGDVVDFTAEQAKRFGPYPGALPRDVSLKPFNEVTKEELARLNSVDTAPDKGHPQGKNK